MTTMHNRVVSYGEPRLRGLNRLPARAKSIAKVLLLERQLHMHVRMKYEDDTYLNSLAFRV